MSILKEHFPMIRDREAVISQISQNANLKITFNSWTTAQQNRFLDYCTGERGLKICYDPFFKEVFNVEYDMSRLNDFLSSIMGERIEIISVLPNEGARIVNLLQNFIFISLDNFKDILQNRIGAVRNGSKNNILSGDELLNSRLEEWLMFLSVDEPELIEVLLRYRPCFRDLYEDIYKMCLNTERLMSMYSEILSELDRNTVVYMIDELKAKVDSQKAEIDNQKAEIKQKDAEIERLKKLLEEKA